MRKMIRNFMGIMVGVPLMGAAAGEVAKLPTGTAKTLAGTAVGLQGVALVGHSMKMLPKSKSPKIKIKIESSRKFKW